jgi:hypothetical protein
MGNGRQSFIGKAFARPAGRRTGSSPFQKERYIKENIYDLTKICAALFAKYFAE